MGSTKELWPDWLDSDCETSELGLGCDVSDHYYWWVDWRNLYSVIFTVATGSTKEFWQDRLIRPWDQWSLIRLWDQWSLLFMDGLEQLVFNSSVATGSAQELGHDWLIRPWYQWSSIRLWDQWSLLRQWDQWALLLVDGLEEFVFISSVATESTEELGQDLLIRP